MSSGSHGGDNLFLSALSQTSQQPKSILSESGGNSEHSKRTWKSKSCATKPVTTSTRSPPSQNSHSPPIQEPYAQALLSKPEHGSSELSSNRTWKSKSCAPVTTYYAPKMTCKSKSCAPHPHFPCKDQWLKSWYQGGKLDLKLPAPGGSLMKPCPDRISVVHSITVAASSKGFGLVLTDMVGKPKVAVTGESIESISSNPLLFHEFMGLRRGLIYVLDYKKNHKGIAMELEVHCYSEVAWKVVDFVVEIANEKVTKYSELDMPVIEHMCGFCEGMPEMWQNLIVDMFNLFVKLLELFEESRGCDADIICGAETEAGTRAAEYMANRHPNTARFEGSRFVEYAVDELKPRDVFPEILNEFLYQNAYELHIPYSVRVGY